MIASLLWSSLLEFCLPLAHNLQNHNERSTKHTLLLPRTSSTTMSNQINTNNSSSCQTPSTSLPANTCLRDLLPSFGIEGTENENPGLAPLMPDHSYATLSSILQDALNVLEDADDLLDFGSSSSATDQDVDFGDFFLGANDRNPSSSQEPRRRQ